MRINDDQLRLLLADEPFRDKCAKILKGYDLSPTGRELNPDNRSIKKIVKDSEGRLRFVVDNETIDAKRYKEKEYYDKLDNPNHVEVEIVNEEPIQEVEEKKESEDVFDNGGLEIFPVVKDKNYPPIKKSAESKAQVVMTDNDRRFLTSALHCWEMKSIDWDEPTQLNDRCKLYFKDCEDGLFKPSVEQLAVYLGCNNRKHLMRKMNDPKTSEEVKNILQRAVGIINGAMVSLAQEGKIPPLLFIFLAKNNYGYEDKASIEIAPVDNIGKLRSEEDIKRRYLAGITEINEEDVIDVKPNIKED